MLLISFGDRIANAVDNFLASSQDATTAAAAAIACAQDEDEDGEGRHRNTQKVFIFLDSSMFFFAGICISISKFGIGLDHW